MTKTTARIIQITVLDKEQIIKVQTLENIRGYLIPNYNIQEVFKLPTSKKIYGIPDDNESQAMHSERIEAEISAKGLLEVYPPDLSGVERQHAIDWNVFHRKSEIVWDFSLGGKGRLSNRI